MAKKFLILILIGMSCFICIGCGDSGDDVVATTTTTTINTTTTLPKLIIIDDYEGKSTIEQQWYYTRVGSDRGEMGAGSYKVTIGGGTAFVNVENGWGGVWTSLFHNGKQKQEQLDPAKLLGPFIRDKYQCHITGIEIDIVDGYGLFQVELKDGSSNEAIFQKKTELTGGQRILRFPVNSLTNIKEFNWLIDGKGSVAVKGIRFIYDIPFEQSYTSEEFRAISAFLFSYGHLSQCYDSSTGLVRDRASWPVEDSVSVQSIGMFALATSIGYDLGYIDDFVAKEIILKTKNAILKLPKNSHGLFPHYVTRGSITQNTEWSSIDSVILLISEIIACQIVGEDTSALEEMITQIDWNDLTEGGNRSISMGYKYNGEKLNDRWDTFGSESFLMALAYAAATGKIAILEKDMKSPTFDGSGFNDEMAHLFFKMQCTDPYCNDWQKYMKEAVAKQVKYFAEHRYNEFSLIGLSASEVPEPWLFFKKEYGAWGVGGHNGSPNDGTSLVGYPIIAPHYTFMIAAEYPKYFNDVFKFLTEKNVFTPLNNVESFGIDENENLHWNSLKGSWNLSLQTIGISRLIYQMQKKGYLPHEVINENQFLYNGYNIMCKNVPITSCSTTTTSISTSTTTSTTTTTTSTSTTTTTNICSPSSTFLTIEGEESISVANYSVKQRVHASKQKTLLLYSGGEAIYQPYIQTGKYEFKVRYSNDGPGTTLENVELLIDGISIGNFTSENTRVSGMLSGTGWDNFKESISIGPVSLASGQHTLKLKISLGDSFGVEIDKFTCICSP